MVWMITSRKAGGHFCFHFCFTGYGVSCVGSLVARLTTSRRARAHLCLHFCCTGYGVFCDGVLAVLCSCVETLQGAILVFSGI